MGRCIIMRYNVRKLGAVSLGALLCLSFATWGVKTLEPSDRTYTPMSVSQWQAQRSLDVLEDSDAWDCRINGNEQCGTWRYELICVAGHTDCVLEGVDTRSLTP